MRFARQDYNVTLATLSTTTYCKHWQYWQNCLHTCRKNSFTWIVEPIDRRYRNGAHRGQTSDCDGDDGGDGYKGADDGDQGNDVDDQADDDDDNDDDDDDDVDLSSLLGSLFCLSSIKARRPAV